MNSCKNFISKEKFSFKQNQNYLKAQKERIELEIKSYYKKDSSLFLIGSRKNYTNNTNSDFDYILILRSNENIDRLIFLSEILNKSFQKKSITIKVFDIESFQNLIQNDYLRFKEYSILVKKQDDIYNFFHKERKSDSDLLEVFKNSVLIQTCWTLATCANKNGLEKDYLKRKLQIRFKRNLYLINEFSSNSFVNSIDASKYIINNQLYKKLLNIEKRNNRFDFFDEYFQLITHELINKSNFYSEVYSNHLKYICSFKNEFHLSKIINP